MRDENIAYRLMRYRTENRDAEYTVWNSRDGLIPHKTRMPDGNSAYWTRWSGETIERDRIPKPGDLVVVDLNATLANELAYEQADMIFDGPDGRLKEAITSCFDSKEQFQAFYRQGLEAEYGLSGVVIEVDEEDLETYGWS